MKISTFNQVNASNIDSLFKANESNLSNMPYLILDLRNNGGGADFSYKAITPYLYTKPMRLIGADVLAADDNIAGWTAIATTNGMPADQKIFISDVVQKMEQHKGELVSFSEDRDITFKSVLPYPKKIVILINKNCGSTTEEFLLMAKQSDKVILMGGHTAGVLDYANIRGADFSCMPYMLYWATSRSRRIDQGLAIDNVGIRPDKYLSPQQNWIEEAKHFLENNFN
nr:S41 family peptidase [Mucilaginibacter sp. UR6-11]